MEAGEGGKGEGGARQWEWEGDGVEEEDVVEGKEEEGGKGGRESPEGKLDAGKAGKLRAKAARRGRRSP